MAGELDEFSGLDQISRDIGASSTSVGASLALGSKIRSAFNPGQARPSTPSGNLPGSTGPRSDTPKIAAARLAPPPTLLPSLAPSVVVAAHPAASDPNRKAAAVVKHGLSLPASHPEIRKVIEDLKPHVAAQLSLPIHHPAVEQVATAAVSQNIAQAASPLAHTPEGDVPQTDGPSSDMPDASLPRIDASGGDDDSYPPDPSTSDDSSRPTYVSSTDNPVRRSPPSMPRLKGPTMATLDQVKDRQFLQPLGFRFASVAAGGTQNVQSTPQGSAFRPIRLVVAPSINAFFDIQDVNIGKDSQWVSNDPVPAETFAPNAVGVSMQLGTAGPGITITIVTKNLDTVVHDFRATMLGNFFKV